MIRPKEDAYVELLECRARRRRAYVRWAQGVGDGRSTRQEITRAALRECAIEEEIGLISRTLVAGDT